MFNPKKFTYVNTLQKKTNTHTHHNTSYKDENMMKYEKI